LEFTYKLVNGNFQLFYITTLNNDPTNRERTSYGMPYNFNEFPIESGNSYTFEISPDKSDTSFNIGPVLYANIPYNIVSGKDDTKPGWIFRQDGNGGKKTFGNQGSIPSTTGNVGVFQHLDSEEIVNATLTSLTDTTLIIPAAGITISDLPVTGTIFLDDTTDEAMYYNGFFQQNTNLVFNISQRGVNGTTESVHSPGVSIYIYDRSNSNNFWYESENPGTDINENFFLYFLPKEKNLYFPKGHPLFKEPVNPSSEWTSSNSIVTYNYVTGGLNYNLNTSPIFFVNAIYNTLPSIYSFDTFDSTYNKRGIYNTSLKTIVLYTEFLDAQQNYFYSYCTTSQFCGNCMGLTKDRQNICTVTSETNDNYVSGNGSILSDIVGIPALEQTGTNINLTAQAGSNIQHPQWKKDTSAEWDNIYYPLLILIPVVIIFILMAIQLGLISGEKLVTDNGSKMKTFNNINAIYYCLIALPVLITIVGFGVWVGDRDNIYMPNTNFDNEDKNDLYIFNDLCISAFSIGILFMIAFVVLFTQGVELKEKESMLGNDGSTQGGKKIPNYIFSITYVMIVVMIITYAILGAFIEIYYRKISSSRGLSEELYIYIFGIILAIVLLGLLGSSHNSHINQTTKKNTVVKSPPPVPPQQNIRQNIPMRNLRTPSLLTTKM
jgi:hypothetical protein